MNINVFLLFRNNPDEVCNRLYGFIERDLYVICSLQGFGNSHIVHHVESLTHFIISTIVYIRNGRAPFVNFMYTVLHPYLENFTEHFCHELFNYERSQVDLNSYDQYVQYSFPRASIYVRLINIIN